MTAIAVLSILSLLDVCKRRNGTLRVREARATGALAGGGHIAYLWRDIKDDPMARNSHHDGPGPSQRQLRVGELIRRTLSTVLAKGDVHDPELNRMSITVGEVRTSPDLKVATVYVMPLGGGARDEAIDALKRNKGELRRALMKDVSLKYAPDLRFRIDETFDRMDETREMLSRAEVRRDVERSEEDEA
jgi:ribosome-binding factor A